MPETRAASSLPVAFLAFNTSNQLAVRTQGSRLDLAFTGADLPAVTQQLDAVFARHTAPAEAFTTDAGDRHVYLVQTDRPSQDATVVFQSIKNLEAAGDCLTPALQSALAGLEPHLIEIPYLHLGENDFIYKFRPEKERNPAIYANDPVSGALYQSKLCAALKTLARQHERSAADPVTLDFGAVQYVLPSHFGFCLGVKNAIERAYETLAANPGRRVFMLSELIHNPFVNEDLLRRGLRYLQSDKGEPFTTEGAKASGAPGETLLWDTLTSADIVIIPAFGATDEDKKQLVRKGLAVYPYDATCMLVEKVWKSARAYGRDGYTVIIHGKHEHEETKATFSNTRRHAPAVIVRNLAETRLLGEIIASEDPRVRARFYDHFAGRHTPGFDVDRHLERIAVVNQTTLLMNETREIIASLRDLYAKKFGPDAPGQSPRVGGSGRNDTLCYATQVNQDALARALASPIDAAFIIGGKNSSNTYQLYRLCEQKLGGKAFFIQSELNIRSLDEVEHYVFPAGGGSGQVEAHPLWPGDHGTPKRVLITGGASCPDGVIQQVITRINHLFADRGLRPVEAVLAELEERIAAED
ncbi:MAG: 4-hydroxy-3-methylbut-2-enyl diphosphate reductase [Verrucomicrobia bacterium]|nr:4-hydroxy-3-methylbut-2-enyl diphosphate reductase [Verrucomicrobiota bacterium]